jgi:hypothetical protein
MSTSTSMSISQFLALRVSGLQGLQVGSGQGDRISGVLDQHPDLAVGVVVGVAVGDARSRYLGPVGHAPAAGSNAQRIRVCSRPVELTLGITGGRPHRQRTALT